MKCAKHPRYKGKRAPKRECLECLSLYAMFGMIRKPIAPPTRSFKDKSKYTRKSKHKKLDE